jgi:hypothetical protein
MLPARPDTFSERIHQALRTWHSQSTEGALDNLLLVQKITTRRGTTTPRMATNQVLLDGLEVLKQGNPGAADLLERRFLNRETAEAVGYNRHQSQDVVFQSQRAAIGLLADTIWALEQGLAQTRLRQIDFRLEIPTYTCLFGIDRQLADIRALLERPDGPWIVSIEGMGGVGKTSLADALARELAPSAHFAEIGWISARRRLFRLSGSVEILPRQADLTTAELADRLIEQFGLSRLCHHSDAEKWLGLKDYLKSRPCLIVIDNLETVPDYPRLVSGLIGLIQPTRFLLTTRTSLSSMGDVHIYTLKPLNRDDTLILLRHEAAMRGLPELTRAPDVELEAIYTVTGGNPLALKLILGQIHSLSLPLVLSRFRCGADKPTGELLTFLHEEAWQALDDDCRRVLQALTLASEGGGRLEQIAAAAGLDESQAASCLHRLAVLSLVTVSGNLYERQYSIHQLTQAFVTRQSRLSETVGISCDRSSGQYPLPV